MTLSSPDFTTKKQTNKNKQENRQMDSKGNIILSCTQKNEITSP